MKGGNIRNPFWSKATRKVDGNWRSGNLGAQQSGRLEDPRTRNMQPTSFERRSNVHTQPDNQSGNTCNETLNEPSTSTSKKMAPRPDVPENEKKRRKSDEKDHDEASQHHPTEPCFTSALGVGRIWSMWSKFQRHKNKSLRFSVLSYNVLADSLLQAHTMLYDDCPQWCLDWEYRKKNLMKEILHYNADILCLQEVQSIHYVDWFEPELSKAGYSGVYKKRTGDKIDGCAIFYRRSTFNLIGDHKFDFCKSNVPIMDRDNIALMVLLQPRLPDGTTSTDTTLCVTNTHLLFNRNRGDIKLLQLTCLFAEIQKSVDDILNDRQAGSPGRVQNCPVILCGDFNMTPFCPLYGLVVQGYLNYQGLNKKALSGQNSPYMKYNDRDRLRRNIIPRELNLQYGCTWADATPTQEDAGQQHALKDGQDVINAGQGHSKEMSRGGFSHAEGGQGQSKRSAWTQGLHQDAGSMALNTSTMNRSTTLNTPTSNADEWPSLGASLDSAKTTRQGTREGGHHSTAAPQRRVIPKTAPHPLSNPSCTIVTHELKFWSAYRHRFPNGAPEVSTYHDKEPSCNVDYIFMSAAGTERARTCRQCQQQHSVLELCGVLGLLTERQIRDLGGLPSDKLSSDHLALQASFLIHL